MDTESLNPSLEPPAFRFSIPVRDSLLVGFVGAQSLEKNCAYFESGHY
jgi:hypothetical protein